MLNEINQKKMLKKTKSERRKEKMKSITELLRSFSIIIALGVTVVVAFGVVFSDVSSSYIVLLWILFLWMDISGTRREVSGIRNDMMRRESDELVMQSREIVSCMRELRSERVEGKGDKSD